MNGMIADKVCRYLTAGFGDRTLLARMNLVLERMMELPRFFFSALDGGWLAGASISTFEILKIARTFLPLERSIDDDDR